MTNKISPTLTTLVRKKNFLQQRIIIPLYQKQIEVIHHTCEMHAELIQECQKWQMAWENIKKNVLIFCYSNYK